MPPREVKIYTLDLLKQISADSFYFRVQCSKGTYIRSLGRDIALKLGSCGHLETLRRTKCAVFTLSDTILLENLKNMVYEEERLSLLLPVETSLRDIAVIAVSAEDAAKLRHGQSVSPKSYDVKNLIGKVAAAMCDDCLTAVVKVETGKISPIRVFNF